MRGMRRLLSGLACAIAALVLSVEGARAEPRPAAEEAPRRGPVLLELFTSQGCSACPPADRLVAALAAQEGLLVLSFHVSYWDHMGWSDPFAIPASVRRQRGYARVMRSRSIYTPQVIVQGAAAAVGSDEARIARLVREAAPALLLPAERERVGTERINVTIPEFRDVSVPLELWAVLFSSAESRFVPNGENAGRRLEHLNVVRQAGIVAVVEKTPALVQFDRPDIAADEVALVLQAKGFGPVVGTGRLSLR